MRLACLGFLFLLSTYTAYAGSKSDSLRIDVVFDAALSFQYINPDSCYTLAQKGYLLSQKSNNQMGISKAFILFGSLQRAHGNYDSAMFFFKKSLDIRLKYHYTKDAVTLYYFISHLFSETGKKDSAFFYLFQGLRKIEGTGDEIFKGWIYTHLGNLYCDYQDYENALKCFHKSMEIARRWEDTSGLTLVNTALGNYYYSLGDLDNKRENIEQALTCFLANIPLSSPNSASRADATSNAALCYCWLKKYPEALRYYQLAMQHYQRLSQKADIALVYSNLGILYLDRHIPDSAILYFSKACDIQTGINDMPGLKSTLSLLAEAYAEKGNFLRAYELHVSYMELSDSLLNAEKISSISEMQTKYETEKKEQQIILLDEQNRTKAAQRNALVAGSIVLLLSLFVLGFYYVQRNRLAKKNQEIANQKIEGLLNETEIKTYNAMIEGQEEERRRIASDLHDRLGSMLSTVKLLFGSLDHKLDKAQEENTRQYEKAQALLDDACSEVRRISHNLNTGMVMSFGLLPALRELCDSIDQSGLIKCKLLAYGMDERQEQSIETGIYRIIQELFSNILKHAKAKNVTVQLNHTEGSLNITVEDDGVGFDVDAKKQSGGMGLKNLEARAAKLNGVYYVDSKPGKGTISIIEIPSTKPEA